MTQYSWWTDERVEVLKKLWDEGHSAGQIGRQMACSRNAVIGKVTRLGLSRRLTTCRLSGALSAKRRQMKQRRDDAKKKFERKTSRVEEILKSDGFVPPAEEFEIPLSERRSLMDLGDHDCRWPIGDPLEADFHFCNQQRITGLPYCATHTKRAFVLPPAKKKKSDTAVPLRPEPQEVV